MIVYQATKDKFQEDVLSNRIDTNIHEAFYAHLARHASPNEVASWRNSMQFMNTLLIHCNIPGNSGVSIEYQVPLTSKRVDFILSGLDADKKENVIIIELKQWESAQLTDKDAIVKTHFQYGLQETTHPSYQAWSYAQMLSHFSETIENDHIQLTPCAYLHNYTPDHVITHDFYAEYLQKAPVFLKNDTLKLKAFIERFIKYGDDRDILYKIENGRIRPSKQLADALSSMLAGNKEFEMIDDQKLVYETALQQIKLAKPDKKRVMIVEGGPGTGKSVVAVNLLVQFLKSGYLSKYVSKNSAPRGVYAALLKKSFKQTFINDLFSGSGAFIDTPKNFMDALIVDEAHRLTLKSGLYGNVGNDQVKEIMEASKFSIFFVDDYQRIHIKDIGSKKYIESVAKEVGATVLNLKLESQFRCNGSDGYLAWLDNALQIRPTANCKLSSEDYDFRIFSDPNELRRCIIEKNAINNKSRMVAGYCWDWKSKKDCEAYDIEIPEFDFKMKWNLSEDGNIWILRENSIEQAGCIHTCQGLELDYVGVIVGKDLSYQNHKVETVLSERSTNDRSIFGLKKLLKEDPIEGRKAAEVIIKNTYRTLFTRGMKGCFVYFCDTELAAYFQSLLCEKKSESDKQQPESATEVEAPEPTIQSIRIERDVNDDVKFVDFLPYYSIKAACGKFGEYQDVEPLGWIQVNHISLRKNMFVIRAVGHSMEPKIQDGDLCIFAANVVGSRNQKIVLVQHNSDFDPESGGHYL